MTHSCVAWPIHVWHGPCMCDTTHSEPRNARAFNARLSSQAHTSAFVLTTSAGVRREHLREESIRLEITDTHTPHWRSQTHMGVYRERDTWLWDFSSSDVGVSHTSLSHTSPWASCPLIQMYACVNVCVCQRVCTSTCVYVNVCVCTWGSLSSPRDALHMPTLIRHAVLHTEVSLCGGQRPHLMYRGQTLQFNQRGLTLKLTQHIHDGQSGRCEQGASWQSKLRYIISHNSENWIWGPHNRLFPRRSSLSVPKGRLCLCARCTAPRNEPRIPAKGTSQSRDSRQLSCLCVRTFIRHVCKSYVHARRSESKSNAWDLWSDALSCALMHVMMHVIGV